jgi:transcriptional regulator
MAQRRLSTVFCPSASIAITPATAKPNNWYEITDLTPKKRHVTESLAVPLPLLTPPRIWRNMFSVTEGIRAMSKPSDLVQGTLDFLLLKILALEPLHGWAIGQRLKQVSGDVLQVSDGSLYPALHKLEQEGWIAAEWKTSELGRRAKFYSLTRPGRRQLAKQAAEWERLSTAIGAVMKLEEA